MIEQTAACGTCGDDRGACICAQPVKLEGGRRVTVGDLRGAFDLVKPAGHWKGAINATLHEGSDLELIVAAVEFFTGSKATATPVNGGMHRILAAGYYAAVGA